MAVEASLKVAEGDTSRPLDVDDFKTPATGAATESSLAALKTANHTDLAAVAAAVASLATDEHFQAFMAANHTDLAEVLTALQGTLLVEGRSVAQTDLTYDPTTGLLVSYVEGGLTWTIARDANGRPTAITSS